MVLSDLSVNPNSRLQASQELLVYDVCRNTNKNFSIKANR
jgi:hypothetical protein